MSDAYKGFTSTFDGYLCNNCEGTNVKEWHKSYVICECGNVDTLNMDRDWIRFTKVEWEIANGVKGLR